MIKVCGSAAVLIIKQICTVYIISHFSCTLSVFAGKKIFFHFLEIFIMYRPHHDL